MANQEPSRVAKRLGADEALIIYRRDRDHMPAHEVEADDAIAEDVKIHWLRTIKDIDQSTFTVEVMRVNEKGRPEPTGELETLEICSVTVRLSGCCGYLASQLFLPACGSGTGSGPDSVWTRPRAKSIVIQHTLSWQC